MARFNKSQKEQRLKEIKNLLQLNKIDVVAGAYNDTKSVLICMCLICEFRWSKLISSLLKSPRCPRCSKGFRHTQDEIKKILAYKNIELLSTFKKVKVPMNYRCLICAYEWKTQVYDIIKTKNPGGCPNCNKVAPLKLKNIKEIVFERNIKILSKKYKNIKNKLKCKCLICNFVWFATAGHLIHSKSGCRNCTSGFGEKVCRFVFETCLNKNFPNVRPDWLKYKNNLELDGFCVELNLAFEHNGRHHYIFVDGFNTKKELLEQQKRDEFKRQKCKELGITLIEIDNRHKAKFNELVQMVKSKLVELNIEFDDVQISEKEFYGKIKLTS